jgi:hypothetical protein
MPISPSMRSMSDAENSARSAPRVVGRPFERGRSGNPGGRPKAVVDVQALAREHTTAAIQTLVAALKDPRHKVAAATALLDRGWGKPQITVHAQHDINMLHLIAAQAVGADLVQELDLTPTSTPEPNVIDLTALPAPTE